MTYINFDQLPKFKKRSILILAGFTQYIALYSRTGSMRSAEHRSLIAFKTGNHCDRNTHVQSHSSQPITFECGIEQPSAVRGSFEGRYQPGLVGLIMVDLYSISSNINSLVGN